MSRQNSQSTSVATVAPPRLQLPAETAKRYNIDQDGWRALVEAVFPNAQTPASVIMALAYCEKNRLDIFQRVVHIVPMWNGDRMVETVWPGIGLLRTIAQRQPDFGGYDECAFGPDVTRTFAGKGKGKNNSTYDLKAEVTYPEWAQFTVYKVINGERVAMPGPKVWFTEAFSDAANASGSCPNSMWQRRPRGQLEKCAEAAALRRAFPDVLGNEYAVEEMEGRQISGSVVDANYVEIERAKDAQAASTSKPRRSDYAANEGRSAGKAASQSAAQRDDEPRDDEDETAALDGPGVPETAEHWADFVRLFKIRLGRCETSNEVHNLQDAQQWRIDKMEPALKSEILDLIAVTIDDFADAELGEGQEAQDEAPEE